MKRLLFSLFSSLVSLALVAVAPIEITVRSTGEVFSPYHEELNALHAKTAKGVHPSASEWKRLKELTEKNNLWFEQHQEDFLARSSTTVLGAWKKKSSYLAPLVMLLWGVMFYFFMRNKRPDKQSLLVLTFPVILLFAQLMSLLEVILIIFVVLAIWMWFQLNPPAEKTG